MPQTFPPALEEEEGHCISESENECSFLMWLGFATEWGHFPKCFPISKSGNAFGLTYFLPRPEVVVSSRGTFPSVFWLPGRKMPSDRIHFQFGSHFLFMSWQEVVGPVRDATPSMLLSDRTIHASVWPIFRYDRKSLPVCLVRTGSGQFG